MTCRYFGKSHVIFEHTGELHTSGGNECALIFNSFSPCIMERLNLEPDEEVCPIVARMKADGLIK